MGINELIEMLEKRLVYNAQQKQIAQIRGDVGEVARIDEDIGTTNSSLTVLRDSQNG